MSRLIVWSKRVGLALAGLVAVAAIGFATVNAISYLQFRRAWHVGDRFTPEELRKMAAACAETEKLGHRRFVADAIPAPFHRLKARSATFYPGCSDFLLYGIGEIGVWMRISTSKQDQEISVFTDFLVPQGNTMLWHKDPAFAERRNPVGRLVTISEYYMEGGRDWIVLPDEIRIIDRRYTVGSSDSVAGVVPLSEFSRRRIVAAIAAIPAEIRGHMYTSGAMDGVSLDIGFSGSGRRQAADIKLSNTWRDEVGPLVESISTCLSTKDAIDFKSVVSRSSFFDPKCQFSLTWAEQNARERHWRHLPWWCVWPRFIHE